MFYDYKYSIDYLSKFIYRYDIFVLGKTGTGY